MKRLFKEGMITTILGCLFMAGAGFLYVFKEDAEGGLAMAGFGLLFLRSKDSLIGIKGKDE